MPHITSSKGLLYAQFCEAMIDSCFVIGYIQGDDSAMIDSCSGDRLALQSED